MHPHEAALRGFLRARFPDLQDVDDVMQEAYLCLWRAHATGPIAATKSYLFVTAKNLALNRLRDLRHEPAKQSKEYDVASVCDERDGIPETLAQLEDFQVLIAAIQSLPVRCRQIITLRKIYGLSQKEVATRLDISEHTVEAQSTIGLDKGADFFRLHGYHSKRST